MKFSRRRKRRFSLTIGPRGFVYVVRQWLNFIFRYRRTVSICMALFIVMGFILFSNTKDAPTVTPRPALEEMHIKVYNIETEKTVDMPLEEYLKGVVSAEMPALFAYEALKAQAVAARTYTLYHIKAYGGSGCGRGDHADVCTDFKHCQAWDNEETQRKKWGEDYSLYANKIAKAVDETAKETITYEEKPILAFYHSVSGGMTEDSEHVFGEALPYLRAVESDGERVASNFYGSNSFAKTALIQLVSAKKPTAKLTSKNLSNQIKILSRYKSGRVEKMQLGKITITGVEARSLFELACARFDISFTATQISFKTTGRGHGVGMSQTGANVMAKEGKNYRDILLYYYKGVTVETYDKIIK